MYFSSDHDPRIGLFKAMSLLCGTEINQGNVQVISLLCSLAVFTSPMLPLIQEDCTLSIDAVYRLLTNGIAQISQPTKTSLYQVSIIVAATNCCDVE